MKPKYLYIDDENPESLESIVNGLNDTEEIDVELVDLANYNSFELLKTYIKDQKPDGLIIDLRLDGEGPNRLDFTATTLAQDLRTLAASDELSSFPMILCSTSSKMRKTYDVDKASHDLFDYKFEKSDSPNWTKFSNKLKSIAIAYKALEENKDLEKVIGRTDWQHFDSRIFEKFTDTEQKQSTNDIAQFVIKELFHHPGILIKEKTLAARLGVDTNASSEEWERLKKEILVDCKFTGFFGDGWERWWFDKVATLFQDKFEGKKLQDLNATQRVDLLNCLGFALVAAKPIETYCKSDEFWTVCEYYKTPLDPLEGFKIYESVDIKPWQEFKYLSFTAALERKGIDKGLRPHPSEKQRIDDLKELLSE
ncbi:MAG: hypothetical protein ACEPOV_10340 [Hyphomicrobiales bacterium]